MGDVKRLPAAYWMVVAIATVLTLARFSEAFLVLRSQNVGLPIVLVPVVMVVMNVIYALAAYPAVRAELGRGPFQVTATGHVPFVHDMNETLAHDLFIAELISLPLALLVLVARARIRI